MRFRNLQLWTSPAFHFEPGALMTLDPEIGAARCAAGFAEPADDEARAMLAIEGWRGRYATAGGAAARGVAILAGWRLPRNQGAPHRPDYSRPCEVRDALAVVARGAERAAEDARAEARRVQAAADAAWAMLAAMRAAA